jgi:zinc transport system ATP-binding protein
MPGEVIAVQDLSFSYSGKLVLDRVGFAVDRGDYIGLVGPNGSGKTTLIRNILGLVSPGEGKISLFGTDLSVFKEWGRIGYLPQKMNSFNLFFPATVREIVGLGLGSKTMDPRGEAAEKAMDLVDVGGISGRLVGELSGGQLQRVFLARALVNEPELLILDEPTSAIDPETREKFFTVLQDLNREKAMTVLLITHDVGTIGKYARKFLYLDRRVIFYDTFSNFCLSPEMTELFGPFSQHVICHMHD